MAKLVPHPLLQGFSGSIGQLTIRKIRGNYYLMRKPQSAARHKPTPAQHEHRARFRQASAYARQVQQTPALHDFYLPFAQARGVRVRAIAISDWFGVPTIERVDLARYRGRAGDPIAIRAADEYGVVSVRVTVTTGRREIESGLAAPAGKAWRYVATKSVPRGERVTITVAATDRPNREGVWSQVWPAER